MTRQRATLIQILPSFPQSLSMICDILIRRYLLIIREIFLSYEI